MDTEHKSQTVREVQDARVEKTRAAISAAFVQLLQRRSYVNIRVSDITRKAGIGRATFYAHFTSKDALLREELLRVVHPLLVARPGRCCPIDATALFAHVQHARAIYRSVMIGDSRLTGAPIVHDAIAARLTRLVAGLPTQAAHHALPGELLTRFLTSTLLAVVAWSLEGTEDLPPARLQSFLEELLGPVVGEPPPRFSMPAGASR